MGAPVAIDIPAGKAGVYAVEFLMQTRRPMMHMLSSNWKVVYAFKPKAGNFLISPVYAGQAWFEPLGGEPLTIGFPGNQVMGRMTLFGPAGSVVSTSEATGTREVKAADHGQRPAGDPIRVDVKDVKPGLYAFLSPTPRDKNCTHYISGTKPWFAARKSAYFDPLKYSHPDLDAIMKEK